MAVTFAHGFSVPEPIETNFDATLDATVVGEFDDVDEAPATNVIEVTDNLNVKVDFEIHGFPCWVDLNEQFDVCLYIESIGPGQELKFAGAPVKQLSAPSAAIGGGKTQRVYHTMVSVPAGTLNPGVYKLVTVVQWESITGAPKYEVAGLVEEPIFTVIDTPELA